MYFSGRHQYNVCKTDIFKASQKLYCINPLVNPGTFDIYCTLCYRKCKTTMRKMSFLQSAHYVYYVRHIFSYIVSGVSIT